MKYLYIRMTKFIFILFLALAAFSIADSKIKMIKSADLGSIIPKCDSSLDDSPYLQIKYRIDNGDQLYVLSKAGYCIRKHE